jgi:hypothetical protein
MKKITIILLIFTISIVLIYGIFSLVLFDTSAKYTDYQELNHYYQSNKLYLGSKSLTEGEGKYNIINYYNYEPIDIEISNSISDTQITNYNIEYQLTCSVLNDANNYYDCSFENNENVITSILEKQGTCTENENLTYEECLENKYNYKLNVVNNKHSFKITKLKDNNYQKVEVAINLNTTSPFDKNLKATYVLNIGNNNKNSVFVNSVKEGNSFCEYMITNNYNNSKKTKITIDTNKFLFDNIENQTSYTTTQEGAINSVTIDIDSYSNQKITLYKKDFTKKCQRTDLNILLV